MGVLSEQGRAALEFVSVFGGNVDAAMAALEAVRPLVVAQRLAELQRAAQTALEAVRPLVVAQRLAELQRAAQTALSTPTEAAPVVVAETPAAEGPCPCGSGEKLAECHGAEQAANMAVEGSL